jgi:hypothetical protein
MMESRMRNRSLGIPAVVAAGLGLESGLPKAGAHDPAAFPGHAAPRSVRFESCQEAKAGVRI